MASPEHLKILKQGMAVWNEWREDNPEARPNLRKANLDGENLRNFNFSDTNLRRADLSGADLSRANLRRADLRRTNLSGATLSESDLTSAILIETNLERAVLHGCLVYGVSAWNIKLNGADQKNLIVSKKNSPLFMVDNLEIAQFIYLLLNNQKIREFINTVGQKAVLILGRFSPPERKEVLDAIADKLRQMGFLPILFDFEGSKERDFTETIKILAGLSLFVIADITNPKSAPLELQATVPDYKIPFVSIIQKGEQPFSMFKDLIMYDWVLKPTIEYPTKESLIAALEQVVIKPALQKHVELSSKKAEALQTRSVENILNDVKAAPAVMPQEEKSSEPSDDE